MSQEEQRLQFSAAASVTPAGVFEIDAISAGDGNGWVFTEEVLQESLPLWGGVSCLVDHGSFWEGRTVRDFGGVLTDPRWSADNKSVRLTLKTMPPSGTLIDEIGRQILALPAAQRPRVGFSADVMFTAKDKTALRILRVFEVCLVYDPARGGQFIRALNSVGSKTSTQGVSMSPNISTPAPNVTTGATVQAEADLEAVRTLLNVQRQQEAITAEIEKTKAVRQQMCQYLLDSGLSSSKLPTPMQENLRKQFANRVFEPT